MARESIYSKWPIPDFFFFVFVSPIPVAKNIVSKIARVRIRERLVLTLNLYIKLDYSVNYGETAVNYKQRTFSEKVS